MPIKHSDGRVLGVCQMVNKSSFTCHSTTSSLSQAEMAATAWERKESWSGVFSRNEEALFEAFALFAGLGIANTQMYEQVLRAEAKQRIAFDVLSYHATATSTEAAALSKELIPSAKYYRLNQFSFTDIYLSVDDTLKACIRMFSDMQFINRFRIDYNVLCRWLMSVKKNYRSVTYHNWRHAFNVAQTMFVMFKSGGMEAVFSELECLSIIIACLSHDLDHRGTNNQFQIRTMSPLVNLYSTSVLEHHHFDQCIMLLGTKGTDILCNLNHDDYRQAVKIMEKAILATDLSRYFVKLPQFRQILDERISAVGEEKSMDDIAIKTVWQTEASNRELLMCMLMTASDVSASTKPWPVQKKLISRVCARLRPLLEGCLANRDCWNSLAKGETVKAESMRLPSDAEGADASYRDRLMALLHAPPSNTGVSLEGGLTVPAAPNPNAAHAADFSTSSVKSTICAEEAIATTSSTTVGGGTAP
ncbi:3',5'-cyclic-AMP phosphodiesterase [Echinococcus granulosus]|uniref:Phosphodiesterase n=1 Tax=Echinococcus granulosus TaxID=6210 RepID=W6UI29_ECHGR|nr:3',5'-cyclic-AMP phosphodiesterase [Echinococcus granulosus]EUB60708.1 3',5'-cyclic-AMP phosphodiesterase [Echinococcus granulosus]